MKIPLSPGTTTAFCRGRRAALPRGARPPLAAASVPALVPALVPAPVLALAQVLALVLVLVAGCAPAAPTPPAAPPPAAGEVLRLQVVHTNDYHGRFLPEVVGGESVGGSAVLAAWFDSARVRFDGPTVVLSGGDIMQGTALSNLSWGQGAIELHNRKGLDASVLGNHEFDWGLDTLRARVSESGFPWLAANILDADTGETPAWIRPWTLIERDGVRVGVLGIALAETPEIVMAGMTEGLHFEAEAPALDRGVRALREQGVDFVVVTTHVGAVCAVAGDPDRTDPAAPSEGCDGHLVEVLEAVTERPDLVVAGHTHLRNLFEVNGIPVVQAEAYARALSITQLERRPGEGARVTSMEIHMPRASAVDPDTAVARVVADWVERVGPILDRRVATFADSLTHAERRPVENPAGNLLADAQRWSTHAQVGLVNNGSLRRSLPAGPATYGLLYEFQPFQNELVLLHMDGSLLRQVLEFGLTDEARPWIHLSGVRVEVDAARPRGERIVRMIRTGNGPGWTPGTEIAPDDPVSVGTTEFLALGGDGYTLLTRARLERTGRVDVDALIDYLQALGDPVRPPPTDRWQGVTPPPR